MDFDTKKSLEFAVDRTAYLLRANTRAVLSESGWSRSTEETLAMLTLLAAGKSLSMGELAQRMIRDATTVKRQLDGLVEAGLVCRERSVSDGRLTMVSLTDAGQEALEAISPILTDLRSSALAGVTRSDQATAMRVLAKIRKNVAS